MANSISQNPRNKVGRNSGGGPVGISAYRLTPAESRRGLRPFELQESPSWPLRLGLGLGMLALVGGGIVALALRRAQQERERSMRGRLKRMVNREW